MSEKIADDYGFTQFAQYLKDHAYTGGTNGTFALATDADMDVILNTGETPKDADGNDKTDSDGNPIYSDWSDEMTFRESVGYWTVPAHAPKGICNYVHVPGNSIIFEYMMNTYDNDLGQQEAVSFRNGGCHVPYYMDAINKAIYKTQLNSNGTVWEAAEIKARYDKCQPILDAHYAAYDAAVAAGGDGNDYSMFTNDDIAYIRRCAYYIGKRGSTSANWEYAEDTLVGHMSGYSFVYDRENYEGAVYDETKARKRIFRRKFHNLGYFKLLFGSVDAYMTYLAGGAS